MSEKEKIRAINKNISPKPIDYEKLNKLSDDFGKRFTPQQELSTEQAFWLRMSNPTNKPSDASPVKIEAPKELPKSSVDKQCLEIAKKYLLLENDRSLQQIMSQDVLLTMMNPMSLNGESVNMERKRNESCDKCFNIDAELLKSQNALNDLLKSYSQLEKYSQLHDKDITICKLKEIIKLMREKSKEENVKYDYCEIETKNVELENSVAKLLSKNERLCKEINHVKQIFKDQFDLIKKTCVLTKEQSDSLIDKLNLKSAENEDLKAQIQDKVFVITSLKNDLRKLKGKEIVDIAAQTPSAYTIVPGMFKLDLKPLAPMLLQNREAHIDYLKITSANVVTPKKITSHSVETQKPELKVYSRKLKNVKSVGCPNCSLVSGLRMFKTYDREPLSAHELSMASEQFSSRPGLHSMTPATSSSGLVLHLIPQQPFQEAVAPRVVVLADSPVSTSIDQDAPSTSIPSTQEQEHSTNISQGFEQSPKTLIFCDDLLHESVHEDSTLQGSLSNMRQTHTLFEHLGKWTKDHPIANMIGDTSRSVSTRKQLQTDTMWCYFDAFLTSIEPKNFKQAMTLPSWIDAMQEEILEF
ncbi:hypothetical protein Tco_0712125 [Tanacetum coccineum]